MSTPIKPPGSGSPTGPSGLDGPGGVARSDGFQRVMDSSQASETSIESAPLGDLDALVADLKAGRVDAAGAMNRLVEQAVGADMVNRLPASELRELEAILRQAVSDDPVLQELTKDLERGR